MHLILQWLGGGFYLLNKIFFSFSERAKKHGEQKLGQKWQIAAWAVYLAGLVPWVILFVGWRNWIAAFLELSGAPAMCLGFVTAIRGEVRKSPRWLDWFSRFCIIFGLACSLYDFGGLNTLNQWLEIGLVVGYLIGTYLLAKEHASGYLWFVLMHISCGALMWIQESPWLVLQQVVSLGFIIAAYTMAQQRKFANA